MPGWIPRFFWGFAIEQEATQEPDAGVIVAADARFSASEVLLRAIGRW